MRFHVLVIFAFIALALGIWLGYRAFQVTSPEVIASRVAAYTQKSISQVDASADKILRRAQRHSLRSFAATRDYSFFLYNKASLLLWSDNRFVPPVRMVADSFSIRLMKTAGGDYLVKKWPVRSDTFLVALIPLHRQYTIRNDYLSPEWNRAIFPEGNINILEPDANLGTPVYIHGKCVFRISFLSGEMSVHERTKWIAIAVISVAIGLLILLLYQGVEATRHRYPELAFFILLGGILVLRYSMTDLNFPGMFIRFPLFDPQNFASSDLNRSLGDLLLNEIALLFLCIYLFRNFFRFRVLKYIHRYKSLQAFCSVLSALAFLFAMVFPYVVIQTIYNNSSITLDISQSLQFDTFRIIALMVILIACACSFFVSHVFARLLLANRSVWRISLYFLTGAIIFAAINELTGQGYYSALIIGFVYFILIYSIGFYKSLTRVSYASFAYLFTAIICFAAIGTETILHFTRKEKIESQFRFASNFLVDRDVFGEYLLQEVSNKITHDRFVQSRLTSAFLSKDAIRQKIRQVFLPSYFNKYDVDIMLFGPGGTPIDNRTGSTFSELVNAYDKESYRTQYEGIYFVNSPASDVAQRYLVVIPLAKSGATAGYVVLELLLKKVIPENVYPELLIDNRFMQFYRTQDLSYAVYGKELLYTSGDFNYERFFSRELLGNPDIHLYGVVHEGYIHVALEDENNRVAVVSSPITPPTYIMANFSFLLVLGLSLLLSVILIQGLVNLLRGYTLFFSARIQLILNLAFFLPLLVVSITTLQLTSLSSQAQLNAEYLSKSKSFGTQVAAMLDNFNHSSDVNQINFENQLTDLAKLFNLDANVYSPQGQLLASSQPLIFENGLISPYVNPAAWRRVKQGESLFITTENVGSLNYFVCFAALKSPQTGKQIGILALPFFQSLTLLEQIQISALANILNVFAGIFIVLLGISYIVSEWLTFPLRFITRSLSRTSLVRTNQPLTWRANDEIGLMVKEYNQMLYKLSESKAELEQTQRERAWREIAQQVAHEIKNPLTPMKLTLQQLERSVKSGNDVSEKISKALASLLAQVDILNDIASSFSSFAKMPEPDIQRIELVTLLRRIVDLHSHAGTINFKSPVYDIFVMGDEQLLGRIFSNIILNAFQAARPGVQAQVDLAIEKRDNMCCISFRDNGKGIDARVADRVFVPHFSTKKTGSGLGMAISRQGIEHMRGKIWFESTIGEGTCFFIELPLA